MNLASKTLALVAVVLLIGGTTASAQEYYYDLDSAYAVFPSPDWIAVQYDTTKIQPQLAAFFAAHSCLDDTVSVTYLP